jgi:uncharacterized protein
VGSFYAAVDRGDLHAAADVFDDDIVIIEPPGHPAAGVHRGKAEILAAMPEIMAAMGWRATTVHQLIADADTVVALLGIGLTAPDGALIDMAIAEVWRLRAGKVIEVQPFY